MRRRPKTKHLVRRVRDLARRIGIPLVFLPDTLQANYGCHKQGYSVMRHDGPTGDVWIYWSWRRNTPVVVARVVSGTLTRQEIHAIIHDLAHAWIWKYFRVSPRVQSEYAGFLCVEHAMVRALEMSGPSWHRWQGNSLSPDGEREWCQLRYRERTKLYRKSERDVLEGNWVQSKFMYMQPCELKQINEKLGGDMQAYKAKFEEVGDV